MDGLRPGEPGVIAWCNTIRFTMAKDPGRQFLCEQIQREGFDWLDNYLEDFLDGPKKEPVIELLKTPGRKKNAPTRTRAATAAAAKSQSSKSMSFEDGATKENREPINDFHKTLLQAKASGDAETETRKHAPLRSHSEDRHPVPASESFNMLKNPRIVTIADSPVKVHEMIDVDDALSPPPGPVLESIQSSVDTSDRDASRLASQGSGKQLSIIAEDDESVERSRISPSPILQYDHADAMDPAKSNETVFHDAVTGSAHDVEMEEEVVDDVDDNVGQDQDPVHGDVTSMSAATFHSIRLSPRESEPEPTCARTADFHTAPLPKVSLPPVPVEDEYSHAAPLPANSSNHEEYTMPLRGEPSGPIPGLSRKPSMPQFAGVLAPSPLRKSLRTPGEPTLTVGAAPSAPPTAVKRTSTSWLSKARETKALENTTKRASTFGAGGTTSNANKRKSSDMLEAARENATAILKSLEEEEERIAKVPKLSDREGELPSDQKGKGKAINQDSPRDAIAQQSNEVRAGSTPAPGSVTPGQDDDDDMLNTLLKKNYVARSGKSTGKSLGGNAAAALAEARAKAEARVAERHKLEMDVTNDSEDVAMASEEQSAPVQPPTVSAPAPPKDSERRLSVSDLVPSTLSKGKEKSRDAPATADTSVSTTPPHTPPRARTISFNGPPVGPVFSKPPAPAPAPAGASGQPAARSDAPAPVRDFKLPTTNPFSIPAAMALGMGPKFAPISAQSSKASIFSDIVFDRSNVSPAWMPSTQDTSYSAAQSQSQPKTDDNDELDPDDSWGVDEKFAGNHMWTPFGFTSANPEQLKDDTMTWSTYPSQSTSQKGGDTGLMQPTSSLSSLPPSTEVAEEEEEKEEPETEQGFAERLAAAAAHQPSDADDDCEADMAMEVDEDEDEDVQEDPEKDDLEDAILAGKSTIKLVKKPTQQARSDSQQSMASTSSSQSTLGFFGHASKLVSSVLGGGKKGKPEVKSLQLAAAAAKKQQEEQEKKAHRLKEMEARRQQAMQRKAEEEKARAAEEERKIKEEAERRKREREEHTDKRPLRSTTATTKKNEDDTTKRKLAAPTSQKPPSKDKKDTALPRVASKPALKSALKQPTAGSSNPVTPGAGKAPLKSVKHAPSSSNIKIPPPAPATGKGKERDVQESSYPQPTRKAPGPPSQEPRVASETIELPDINSEYSDSDDEDRPKRDLPDWAKSPDIAAALQQQSTINPDDIFGRIGPLRMEEIFRTRHSRFRARTSSANWTGTDELTQHEEKEYARRMGFK
ncbi:hypothetical protein OH76DRAFT_1460594 [Lentinus brumalis]|uniref:Inner centromere protein ARK-binding domain-containing protein n=1 Tax=Lentinus brumalis TaxID=2498619 RepID=A0A371DTM8_9APHY|nr:hypothetical protein OH76DRAFT_1460594 [Polyporus brumalis]